ncbi:DUF423 domain-containing protein [Brevibacillus sp. SYP-B805]|uniref:DUF423 domain-containing protein n=1 Tax=Brevibacillus sp. SYP-B805 TaxID=1578199 RepID=UPI0013EB3066|nr:DUF423 domain-containing protein [Brevibacillus sp. SYP-B805]
MRVLLLLGSLSGFLSVALGAFAAHGLKPRLSEYQLSIFQTGVHYQAIHAIALILAAILLKVTPAGSALHWAGWCFFAGILFFSGSLYALALTGIKVLGAITPIGGVLFLAGWLLLAYHAWTQVS